jgi:hypothetical protein
VGGIRSPLTRKSSVHQQAQAVFAVMRYTGLGSRFLVHLVDTSCLLQANYRQDVHEIWQLGNRMDKMLKECASSDKAKTPSTQEI